MAARTTFDKIATRYLHDPAFHALVTSLQHELIVKQVRARDLRQAVRFAIVMARVTRKQVA